MFGGNYFYCVNIIVRTNWDRRVENQPLEITTTNNYLSATRNWQRRYRQNHKNNYCRNYWKN